MSKCQQTFKHISVY